MGNSASKSATSGAKSAARHFPTAASLQERAGAATATAVHASAKANANAAHASINFSPKQDYLAQQKKLEEEIARYDREIGDSGKLDGETRPLEDTPSAAEMQFFGNLRTIGQVKVDDPDQVKHHEAEAMLKRKLPSKSTSSSSSSSNKTYIPSSTGAFTPFSSSSTVQSAASTGSTLTSLKLMNILQLRNRDPSVWTLDRLSEEFDIKKQDLKALTQYINTYTILPGKDAKGREAGVWCEDIRGVEILEKPSAVTEAEEAAGIVKPTTANTTSTSKATAPSSSPSSSSSSSSSSAAKSVTGERRST